MGVRMVLRRRWERRGERVEMKGFVGFERRWGSGLKFRPWTQLNHLPNLTLSKGLGYGLVLMVRIRVGSGVFWYQRKAD